MAPAQSAKESMGVSSGDGAQGEWRTVLPKSAAQRFTKDSKRVAPSDGALSRSSGSGCARPGVQ
eukprot:15028880-Alexandrium_andersonii.AAC.1